MNWEEWKCGAEAFEKITAGNVQIWWKTNLKSQEAQQTSNKTISKKSAPDTSNHTHRGKITSL